MTAGVLVHDATGDAWYRRRFGRWCTATTEVARNQPDVLRQLIAMDTAIEIAGFRRAHEATDEFHMSDFRHMPLQPNLVDVMAETWVWLTKRQEWELRIKDTESWLATYRSELADGVDEDGDPIDAEYVQTRIDAGAAALAQLRADLAAMTDA